MNYLEQIEGKALQLTALSSRYRKAMEAEDYDPDIFQPVGWGNVVTFRCGVFYIHEMGGEVRVTAAGIEVGICKGWNDAFMMVKREVTKEHIRSSCTESAVGSINRKGAGQTSPTKESSNE